MLAAGSSLRRLSSIPLVVLLLSAFLFPMVAPALASDSAVPACCRRNGKHHCGMLQAEKLQAATQDVRATAPVERCPFQQKSLGVAHHDLSTSAVAATNTIALIQEPTAPSQAECLRRISFDRSRQKRGPPVVLS
jgi:hypothetical protein